jgi:amino acid transporter
MAVEPAESSIRARLSTFDTAMVVFSLVVGIGIFRTPAIVAGAAGGYYRVVADCYNPTLAFMLNWSQTLMQGAGAAGVAFIGADYLTPMLLPPQWRTPHASLALAHAQTWQSRSPPRPPGRAWRRL